MCVDSREYGRDIVTNAAVAARVLLRSTFELLISFTIQLYWYIGDCYQHYAKVDVGALQYSIDGCRTKPTRA